MLHAKTKQMQATYNHYLKSQKFLLRDCYTNYSTPKLCAFKYCKQQQEQYNGHRGRIIAYNTQIFTFGFLGEINGKEAFFYITPSYSRYIYLDELET